MGDGRWTLGLCSAVAMSAFPGMRLMQQVGAQNRPGLNEQLIVAVQTNDAERVKLLLAQGADANASRVNSGSALFFAVANRSQQIVEALISKGADVNRADAYQHHTPLTEAAAVNEIHITEVLLEAGAEVNREAPNGFTPLMWAANSRSGTNLVQLLLDKHADVNLRNRNGETALKRAAMNDAAESALLLLAKGADPNTVDVWNWTPIAVAHGAAMVKVLLAGGARPDRFCGPRGETALMAASRVGSTEVGKALLTGRAKVNLQEWHGRTALMMAAANNHMYIVAALLEHHAAINLIDKSGWTALHWARSMGAISTARMLVKAGAHG